MYLQPRYMQQNYTAQAFTIMAARYEYAFDFLFFKTSVHIIWAMGTDAEGQCHSLIDQARLYNTLNIPLTISNLLSILKQTTLTTHCCYLFLQPTLPSKTLSKCSLWNQQAFSSQLWLCSCPKKGHKHIHGHVNKIENIKWLLIGILLMCLLIVVLDSACDIGLDVCNDGSCTESTVNDVAHVVACDLLCQTPPSGYVYRLIQ